MCQPQKTAPKEPSANPTRTTLHAAEARMNLSFRAGPQNSKLL